MPKPDSSVETTLVFTDKNPELTVVMPCLNEVLTVGTCIEKAQKCLDAFAITYEIIIADNGSTDGSIELAEQLGARVVHQTRRGYCAALKAGIAAAKGYYTIMGDCDDSYDFSSLEPFVKKLREGYFLVMGNRFAGGIKKGAMPPLHRYFGNPFLTFLGRTFFKASSFGDFYCGLRGFRTESVRSLNLHSDGMEFALEMVIKFTMRGDWATEVPTTLSPDGRDRAPHLRSFRDGWRSLRFYLIMAPRWMFGIPGMLLLILGTIISLRLHFGPIHLLGLTFDFHTLLYTSATMLIGYQMTLMGVFAKLLAVDTGLHPPKTHLSYFRRRSALMTFLLTGLIVFVAGLCLAGNSLYLWSQDDFGEITQHQTIRVSIASVTALLIGFQTILAGFLFGLFNLVMEHKTERSRTEES